MTVVGLIAVAVVDDDEVSVAAHPAGVRHRAAVGGVDGRAVAVADIDAAVVGAAQQTAVAEPAGQHAVARPAEAAGGIPCGALLGAPQLLLRYGLGQGDAGHHLPLHLLAVDVRDVGGDVRLAVYAGGSGLVLALIHGRVVGVLHLIGHVLHVPLALHVHHRQIGHGVADGQHVAHPEDLGVVALVQLHQILHGHVIVGGDAVIAVAGGDGVCHLALLRLVELFSDVAQVHHIGGLHILLPDLHVLHEIGVDGIRRLIAQLQLLQQILQRAGTGGSHDLLPVHIQHIGVFHLTQRAAQLLLELIVGQQFPAGIDACLHRQLRRVHGIGAVAGGLAGDVLQLRHHLLRCMAGGDHAQRLPVIADLGAQGVQRQHRGGGGNDHRAAQEDGRMQLYLLKEAAALVAQPDEDLAPVGEVLPHRGGEALQTAAEKQEKLRRAVFRLREAPVTVSGRQRPRAAAQVGQPLPQTADACLNVQREQVVVLVAEAPPAH